MQENVMTISLAEYKRLIELEANMRAFEGFVKRSKYAIDREDCARYFGFELEEDQDGGSC